MRGRLVISVARDKPERTNDYAHERKNCNKQFFLHIKLLFSAFRVLVNVYFNYNQILALLVAFMI